MSQKIPEKNETKLTSMGEAGRELARRVAETAQKEGMVPVYQDTDTIYFAENAVATKKDFEKLYNKLERIEEKLDQMQANRSSDGRMSMRNWEHWVLVYVGLNGPTTEKSICDGVVRCSHENLKLRGLGDSKVHDILEEFVDRKYVDMQDEGYVLTDLGRKMIGRKM